MACSSGNTGTVTATEGSDGVITFVPATDGYPFEDANHGEWQDAAWWIAEYHYTDGTSVSIGRTASNAQPPFVTSVVFATEYTAASSKLVATFTIDTDLIPTTIDSILIGVASTSSNQTTETESDFCLNVRVAAAPIMYARYFNSNVIGRLSVDDLAAGSPTDLWTAEVSSAFDGTGFFYVYNSKIYYTARSVASPTLQALWRRDLDGTGAEEVFTDTGLWTNQQRPMCGRGDQLFFALASDLYIMTLPDGTPTQVSTQVTPWWAQFAGDPDKLFFWNFNEVELRTISTWTLVDSVDDYVWHGQYDEATDRLYGVNGSFLSVGYYPDVVASGFGDPWDGVGSTWVELHAWPTVPDDPSGIYVDTVNSYIYWTDKGSDEIWRMGTDGSGKTLIRSMDVGTPWPEQYNKNTLIFS